MLNYQLMPFIVDVLFSFVIYYILFLLNFYFFNFLNFDIGVDWIFLPAGLRVILTYCFGIRGAIGIAISSFIIGLTIYPVSQDINTEIGIGFISGFAPICALYFSYNVLNLQPSLNNLNTRILFLGSCIYALFSSTMHQYWFYLRAIHPFQWQSLFAMFIGDLNGTFLLLLTLRFLIKRFGNNGT